MAIVKRKDINGKTYYYDTTKMVRSSEVAYNRSKGAAKKAKTQFKTPRDYACASAARIMGKQAKDKKGPPTRSGSAAGRKLRKCQ